MSLDRGFHKWLSKRGVQPATIDILKKESILHENTLKLLRPADLDVLRSKHHITMGQFVVLRTAHGDLLATEGDGFELVGMEDVPAELGGGGGGGGEQQATAGRSRRNSKGEKYRVNDKKQSTKDVLSDNLDKAAIREKKLQNVAEVSERVVSSADEYNRLATLLAQKKKRESGLGFFHRTQRSSSSSSMETGSRASGKRPSSTVPPPPSDNYDHLDNLSPPPQPSQPGKSHVQLEPGSDDVSGPSNVRHRKDGRNGYRQVNQNNSSDRDESDRGTDNCCIIL